MNKSSILIDSVYINTGGGKKILNYLIKQIKQNHDFDKYFFLLDNRIELNNLFLDSKNFYQVHASEKNRKFFYKKNYKKFKSVLCMSNVPPPINLKVKVSIYFHNDLLLNPLGSNLKLKIKLINFIKKHYIIKKNKSKYYWIVQTDLIKDKLINSFSIKAKQIQVLPIFELEKRQDNKKIKNKFLYVSNFSDHKNHFKLFNAFVDVSEKIKEIVELHLTLDKKKFNKSFYSKGIIPKNLNIINHGVINENDIIKLYSSSEFLIYPSLNESFGLPLVEAVSFDCKVLASELDYVDQVITPSLTFNPHSVQSISNTIFKAISREQKRSEIIIENKIDTFVEYISEND